MSSIHSSCFLSVIAKSEVIFVVKMFSVYHQLLVVVCFVFFDFVNSQNNVLCELYQSTSISERVDTGHIVGWECVDGEPDSELCEEWSGVKCDRRGHVKYLDISGQNLTGRMYSCTFIHDEEKELCLFLL